jgi:hypothetical protein
MLLAEIKAALAPFPQSSPCIQPVSVAILLDKELREFVANPNRDASDTIAGFVYQVDVTLLHWLGLQPGEVLELERGEDIDVIQDWLKVGNLRTLEQVKRRSSSLTLRSPEAIGAVANFCEHKALNRDQTLRFRYITTSRTGKERTWTRAGTAIESWELLRQGKLSDKDRAGVVSGIRTFLQRCTQPPELSSSAWECLQSVLTTEDDTLLIELIESFEWSTSSGDDFAKESEIRRALIESGFASDESVAQALFERLFLYVFRKLTQKGLKRLTPVELTEQLAQPPLSSSDQQIFLILGMIRSTNRRVDALEQQFSDERQLVAALGSQVSFLTSDLTIDYRDPVPNLDSPSLVQPFIPRTAAVDQIAHAFEDAAWVSLVGEPGLGKTQLCVLASGRLASRNLWINMRERTEDQACAVLDVALEVASGTRRHALLREWYKQVVSELKGTAIVLDDLPKMFGGGRLAQRLDFLRSACSAYEVRLLTASYYPVPRYLTDSDATHEFIAPRLSNTEIGELLVAYGAPKSFANEAFAEFLSVQTQRLPVLVTAVAKFLAGQNWNVEWPALESLLKGHFANGIRQDAEGMILATIPDSESRELLYRLRLIVGTFSRSEVEAICQVPKAIELGLEKFVHLTGLWVQEYEKGKYQVSALLDSSLSLYLESKTRRGVHATLALRVLSKKRLNQADVFNAFYHFVAAELLQRAVLLLIQALLSLIGPREDEVDDWGISTIWADQALASEIDINLRLYLRALQIGAFQKRSKDISFLVRDFDLLVQDPGSSGQWGVFLASGFLGIRFAYTNPKLANKYLLLGLRNSKDLTLPNGVKLEVPEKAQLEMCLWVTAHNCQSDEDVEDWLSTIGQLTKEQLVRLAKSDLAKDNSVLLCDSIWLREYRKLESERDWDRVERLLVAIETRAVELGFPLLRAAAIRTQILILAEWRGKVALGIERAERALADSQTDDERFLLLEVTGRQLAYADEWAQAVEWLQNALKLGVVGFPIWQRNDLLTLSEGIAKSDLQEATRYTQEAVELSEASMLEPIRTAEALGEHSIALWFASDRKAAFDALQRGVTILIKETQGSFWTKTFLLFLHTAGYFGSVALTGSPPNASFESPRRGMFLATDNVSADLYKPVQHSLLFMRLAMLADGVGNAVAASLWAKKALEGFPGESGVPALVQMFAWLQVTSALLIQDWRTPVEITEVIRQAQPISSKSLEEIGIASDFDPERLAKAEIAAAAVKDRIFHHTVVPLVFRLATLRFDHDITAELKEVTNLFRQASKFKADEWEEAANLVNRVFDDGTNWTDLYKEVNRYNAAGRPGFGAIADVGCILGSPLVQSLAFQIQLAETLEQIIAKRSSMWKVILEPFFLSYWKATSTRGDFAFRTAASYTQRRVAELSMMQPGRRLRPIFREMAFCLGWSPSDERQAWLDSAD